MSEVRVRFAPAPTGTLHIGNVRTALFNWLFARHHGGCFILRIEDTDRARSRQEWADQIMDCLRWLGLDWDEGPYYQSQRLEAHQAAAARLVETGCAYPCFCTAERLDQVRQQARTDQRDFVYDRHCLQMDRDEVRRRLAANEPHTIRFRVPDAGATEFEDLVYGPKTFENPLIGDFVIVRSDGAPTFLLTCAVDDHDMGITHVIRGDDHLSNTPKQILILRALGWQPPRYASVPLICGSDRAPLSKRHGATAFVYYRDNGYLPEALMNFLALLGWAYDETSTIFSRAELIEKFSIERVSRSPAVFDTEKLLWMNGHYIRALPEDEILTRVRLSLAQAGFDVDSRPDDWLRGIVRLEIPRCKTLNEFPSHLAYFFRDEPDFDDKAVKKHLARPEVRQPLQAMRDLLATTPDLGQETLEPLMRALTEKLQVSFGKVAQPLRVALTGGAASPPIFDVLFHLGKDRVLRRLDHALANLVP